MILAENTDTYETITHKENSKLPSQVKCKHIDFWYGSKQILYDINLKIPQNQITALIGPSGCGKSTLLRCMNRMNDLIPSAKMKGIISYRAKNIYDKDVDVVDLRKKVGMVFQKPNPFPMSIYENVAYGPKLQNIRNKKELNRIVRSSLIQADLWEEVKDKLHDSAFALSGGQQQRLCIARSIAVRPDVLLLDEPCSALDPISTAKIEALLVQLKERMTIIIVTHNMQQAKRVSDLTAYLLQGKLIEVGKTEEVFVNAKHHLTKQYIEGKFG